MFITTLVVLLWAWLNHNTMEDLQFINDIVNQSTKEASYWSVVISSTVFIIYTIVIRVFDYFKTKDKDKPLLEMSKAIQEVSNNVIKLNTVLDKMIQDNSKKDFIKCKNTIELSFIGFYNNVFKFCQEIILHNNIEANKDSVKQSIYRTVSTEYYKIYSIFSAYEYDKVNVATRLKEEWIDAVTEEVLQIIYNGQDAIDRIRQINNKLSIDTEEYSTYINNKVFNH